MAPSFLECYEKKDYASLYYLGKIYEKGINHFVKVDFDKAIYYYELGVEFKNKKAIKELADYYKYGIHPIKKDKTIAMKYAKMLNGKD